MEIKQADDFIQAHLEWRLDPRITIEQIEAALPGIEDEGESADGKKDHAWWFLAGSHECGIWDMRGLRWSAFGPREVFEQLGLTVVGGPDDYAITKQIMQETGL